MEHLDNILIYYVFHVVHYSNKSGPQKKVDHLILLWWAKWACGQLYIIS